MSDDYHISISRTPDGRLIVTGDPKVPLDHECVVEASADHKKVIYIHLDVIHDGMEFPVWFCDSEESVDDPDLEQKIVADKREKIIEAIRSWESKQHPG